MASSVDAASNRSVDRLMAWSRLRSSTAAGSEAERSRRLATLVANEAARQSFQRSAQSAGRLRHPGTALTVDRKIDDGSASPPAAPADAVAAQIAFEAQRNHQERRQRMMRTPSLGQQVRRAVATGGRRGAVTRPPPPPPPPLPPPVHGSVSEASPSPDPSPSRSSSRQHKHQRPCWGSSSDSESDSDRDSDSDIDGVLAERAASTDVARSFFSTPVAFALHGSLHESGTPPPPRDTDTNGVTHAADGDAAAPPRNKNIGPVLHTLSLHAPGAVSRQVASCARRLPHCYPLAALSSMPLVERVPGPPPRRCK